MSGLSLIYEYGERDKHGEEESETSILITSKSMSFLTVYVTHPSKPEAATMTAALLTARLIACANTFPIESVYWWEGFLTKNEEIVTLYKTLPEKYDALEAYILAHHKYEIPCIMKLATVEANASYEAWIHSELSLPPKL